MRYRRFEDLPVWREAAALARSMYEFTALEPFRRHHGLRDQLERAALSVSNNVAEGFERGTTNELLAFLYIARGSAGEVRSMLRVLEGWNNFDNGWIEDLKRTEISGQRHLDEKAKTIYASRRDRDEFLRELRRINEAAAEQRRKSRKPGNVS